MSKPGFNYQKDLFDSAKDGSIVTFVSLVFFYGLKAVKIKPPTASLDLIDGFKFFLGIGLGTLAKDYMVYKKWINE